MINLLIAGIGGQGTVLAAKVLAQAAQNKGWQVRTAETIGMAQRGGNVTSHVRMGNNGERVHAPLLTPKTADAIIAFEPGEALRVLSFAGPNTLVVTARTAVPAVSAALARDSYDGSEALAYLEQAVPHFLAVDDESLCNEVGNRKCLNILLVASMLAASCASSNADEAFGTGDALTLDDLKEALAICVKPHFLDLNNAAVDAAARAYMS